MPGKLSKDRLLELLKRGVRRTVDLMAQATEFHGAPAGTEYLITTDIARELIESDYQVKVECLNESLINAITKNRELTFPDKLGKKRTDVAIVDSGLLPRALIEVKIRVGRLSGVMSDLDKICDTIRRLGVRSRKGVWGVSLFQVHVKATKRRIEQGHFAKEIEKLEKRFRQQLDSYSQRREEFEFEFCSLQEGADGIEGPAAELIVHEDGTQEYTFVRDGRAIRYYAVVFSAKV